MQKLKVGVIFGGMSTEHEVSINSAKSVIQNLNKEKYEVFPIYIKETGEWFECDEEILSQIANPIEYLKNIDVVFPVLHGLYGEDGTLQGMLELTRKKYVGCKVLASSISMDKVYTKIIFDRAKILQADYIYLRKIEENYIYIDKNFNEVIYDIDKICEIVEKKLNFPVFVKPSNSGSSIGVKKAYNSKELIESIEYASKFDKKILIEQNIEGREIECAILGNEEPVTSVLGEILPAEDFYTFDAKYKNIASKTIIPAKINRNIEKKVKKLAIKAFKAVDGSGLSRVDFFIEKSTNKVYINEINTLPGFTEISMYPKLFKQEGIEYSELLDRLIQLSLE